LVYKVKTKRWNRWQWWIAIYWTQFTCPSQSDWRI